MYTRTDRGLTFIEALVWVGVFIAAMLATVSSLLYFYRTNDYALKAANAIASAQHGMDVAVRALRTASYANDGSYPIISIGSQSISFYSNVLKGDPYTQRVRLFVQGTQLFEGIVQPSGDPPAYTNPETIYKLSDYVQNPAVASSTFFYYDKNGAAVTDYSRFADVRFVIVNLIVDPNVTALPNQLTLTSSAALRNLVNH